MSVLLDANVLLYAFNGDVPQHELYRTWLQTTLASGQPVFTTALNEVALVRIATGPMRLRAEDAFQFLHDLSILPNYARLALEPAAFSVWRRLVQTLGLSGNDINDAYLASLAPTYNLTLVSADQGFARFPDLKLSQPT